MNKLQFSSTVGSSHSVLLLKAGDVVAAPRPQDVISTRNRIYHDHPGNRIYMSLIEEAIDVTNRSREAQHIIDTISRKHMGVFLKQDPLNHQTWYVMDDKSIMTKVMQATANHQRKVAVAEANKTNGTVRRRDITREKQPTTTTTTTTLTKPKRRLSLPAFNPVGISYQAMSGESVEIHRYMLDLITMACNQATPHDALEVLELPLSQYLLPNNISESPRERTMRLQLRQRYAAALSVGMTPIQFSQQLIQIWGGQLVATSSAMKRVEKQQPSKPQDMQSTATPKQTDGSTASVDESGATPTSVDESGATPTPVHSLSGRPCRRRRSRNRRIYSSSESSSDDDNQSPFVPTKRCRSSLPKARRVTPNGEAGRRSSSPIDVKGWKSMNQLKDVAERHGRMAIQYRVMYNSSGRAIRDQNMKKPRTKTARQKNGKQAGFDGPRIQNRELVVQSRFACATGSSGGNSHSFARWRLPGARVQNKRQHQIYDDSRPSLDVMTETSQPLIVIADDLDEEDRDMVQDFLLHAEPGTTPEAFFNDECDEE